jgi:hypothetical protein
MKPEKKKKKKDILTFTFLDSRREDKRLLNFMLASIPQILFALNIFMHAVLIY